MPVELDCSFKGDEAPAEQMGIQPDPGELSLDQPNPT